MKRTRTRVSPLAFAIAAGLLAGLAPTAHADDRKPCSNASLKGSFGFYRSGTNADGPIAAEGILFFDGKGNADVIQTISRNGEIELDVEFPSTYEVAPNCTTKGFTTDGVEFVRGVVVDGGKGFYFFSETPGNTIYGVATRIHVD